jgi:hypothetical protein
MRRRRSVYVSETYVTDYIRFVKTPLIYANFSETLNNKLIFDWMIRRIRPDALPKLCGILLEGRLHSGDGAESLDAVSWLEKQLRSPETGTETLLRRRGRRRLHSLSLYWLGYSGNRRRFQGDRGK